MSTKIKYALEGRDSFLFVMSAGSAILDIQIKMDSIVFEGKIYKVVSRLADFDDGSYIILLEETKWHHMKSQCF